MSSIKYHTVNTIIKIFLKTGKTTKAQMGGDKKFKLLAEVKKSLLQHVGTDCTRTLKELEKWFPNEPMIEVSLSTKYKRKICPKF